MSNLFILIVCFLILILPYVLHIIINILLFWYKKLKELIKAKELEELNRQNVLLEPIRELKNNLRELNRDLIDLNNKLKDAAKNKHKV